MLVSNDYVIRSMGSNITQVPEDKNDVNDDNFESILKKIGSHQVFLDFSRCLNITPKSFYLLEMCKSLLYLDVSYTSIADLSVISNNCAVLKGLNLAGTKLQYHSHTNSNSNSYINNTYINNSNNSNSYTRTCNNNNSTRRSYPLKNSDIKGKKSLITSSSTLNTNSNPDSSDSITNSIDSSTNKQNSDPFETLSNLLTLEILSARNTEFNNLEILLPLICLRSLDLGKTKIKHINNIDILYRLEELLLDCNYDLYTISNCNSDVGNSCDNSTIGDSRQLLSLHDKNKVLTSFSKLSKLKVLNVQDTVLLPLKDNIQNVLHPDAYIEHKTRR